ncbi:hypothetical protein TRFO_16423 [Tritrichomonas foetus]|uniref:Uncharacterized protein n=1 Tax=Tritrichomonas foetus TaxID=1144522 RepID=A0A1J4KQB5_9EUKA|nr:hypothetical protein TRFO_16423 [Tritrichomonas foetus]|eukprot:OHT13435.1 hypothetical protein TRFO_16423 [Tritrichomonas foetus]
MLDSESSSIWETSHEVKEQANEALKSTMEELQKDSLRQQSFQRSAPVGTTSTFTIPEPDDDELKMKRQQWAKTQINEINDQTKHELQSLEALRTQQQELYQEQLAEKNDMWERVVLQRREEAAELRSMISNLSSAISSARNQAKEEIAAAKRKAAESINQVRAQREKQLQQIAELTEILNREKVQFDNELKQIQSSDVNVIQQKKDQIQRLQLNLQNLRQKLSQKETETENRFKVQVRSIRDLRLQLQQVREAEADKQNELMSMRKACAVISRKISARKDEAASLKRQLAMLQKDNEELQNEIIKMESNIFPAVFQQSNY